MHTVVMPKMGDTMEEGKILNWLKHEGDTVNKGDALAEIETEKVNIEVEAFAGGVLRKIIVPAGQTVPVGAPIALTGTADEPLPAGVGGTDGAQAQGQPQVVPSTGSQAEAAPEATAPQPVAQPASAEGHARPQQPAAQQQQQRPISLEDREYQEHTDVVAETSASANGYSTGARAGNGRTASGVQAPAQPQAPTQTGGRIFISPVARHIAAEHGLDIAEIQGTGPNGRIIRGDVEAALAAQQAAPQAMPAAAAQAPVPAASVAGEDVRAVPLSQMRKTIAKRLQQSMQTAPHFYMTVAIDATRLGELRQSVNEYAAGLPEPLKISVNDLIVKGVALALRRMPEVNVSFDGERLLFKQHVNVGIAVALEQGLIVPVIRDADKRGLLDIAKEARRLAEAARASKLKPEEFQGGTFSISNLGMFDVEEFTAVINPPESAILAVGSIVPTPVVREGQVVVRDIMKVTLSVDHRALDGATAARFLQEVKRLLEQPMGMLI
jgi:pyruvate dehydrogenase E2 component (dihydrolipoamide acetyltransferase)